MIRRSWPSILTSVPDHLPNRTRSPALTSSGYELAALVAGAGADGDDLALLRLLLGGIGDDDAALGLLFALEAADDDAVVQGTEFHGTSSYDCERSPGGRVYLEFATVSTVLVRVLTASREIRIWRPGV